MSAKTWFQQKLVAVKDSFEFRFETHVLTLTEKICRRMEQKKINRVALANRLQVTPPAITKLLRGSSNFTLKKLLSIADALEMDLKIDFEDKNFSHYQIILKSGSICGLSDQKPVGSVSGGHIFVTSSTSPIPALEIKDLERIEHEPRISQAA